MPCRREEEEEAGEEAEGEEDDDSFLLLEQSVTLGGSADVDRLIAQIGETLQLDAAQRSPASPPPRALAALAADKARAPARPLLRAAASAEAPAPPGAVRCALGDRGRVRGRAAPYCVAELAAGPGALPGPCRRGWLRGAIASRRLQQRRWTPAEARTGDDDPHRLLQQLVLSGNLIKEAVRRLQRAVAAVAATSPAGAPGAGEPEADRTRWPCSPRAPGSDPGLRRRKTTSLRRPYGVLFPGHPELCCCAHSAVVSSEVTGRARLLEKTESVAEFPVPPDDDLPGRGPELCMAATWMDLYLT